MSNSTSTSNSNPTTPTTASPSAATSSNANTRPTTAPTTGDVTSPTNLFTPTTTPSTTSTSPPTTSSTPSSSSTPATTTPSTSTTPQTTPTTAPTTTPTPEAPFTTTATSYTSNTVSTTSSSTSITPTVQSGAKSTSSGLSGGGKIAVAVVVPIVAVALIVIGLLFLWRKRKQRKDAEELRRKEVEEYGYNPNNDPTLAGVASASGPTSDGPFEMREEGSSGYRGWGTTAVPSSGRKASTTVSGGHSAGGVGLAYSDGTSPTRGALSDTRSENPLMGDRSPKPSEAEELGAMGPAASGNRGGDINRGPSNASSQYSTANRSDASGDAPVHGGAYGQGHYYANDQYDSGNPYGEPHYGSPPDGRAEMSGQPVIRDVQARRNTRIENPSHFPQQSAGISQNF